MRRVLGGAVWNVLGAAPLRIIHTAPPNTLRIGFFSIGDPVS